MSNGKMNGCGHGPKSVWPPGASAARAPGQPARRTARTHSPVMHNMEMFEEAGLSCSTRCRQR